jgi:hypothetical protein
MTLAFSFRKWVGGGIKEVLRITSINKKPIFICPSKVLV